MEGGVRIATAQQLVDDCEKRPTAVIKKYQPNAGVNKLIVEGEVKELQTWTFGGLGGATVVFVSEGKLAVHARLKSGAQTALNPGDKARVEGIFQGTSQWTGDENKILMASAKVLWPDSPTRVSDAEEKALALIKNQSPGVERDEAAPGKPVTGVALYGQRETDATLKELCAFKCLKTLSLSSPSVTDAGLKELAALKNLYQLNVGGTSVTDAGLKELAALKYLTSLTLNKTKVTDIGLKELAAIKNLKSLNLADTKVTDAGIKELVALKNLTYLDLAGTKVSGAGLNQLRSALPTCKIGK